MNKISASFLIISFLLWLLPLGYFIKPGQEKLACDGQRAVCMCHALVPKGSRQAMEPGMGLRAGGSTHKDNATGGGNYFISVKPPLALPLLSAFLVENQHFFYRNPYLTALEHVPKINYFN